MLTAHTRHYKDRGLRSPRLRRRSGLWTARRHAGLVERHPDGALLTEPLSYDMRFTRNRAHNAIVEMVGRSSGRISRSGIERGHPRPTASARPGTRTASTGRSVRSRPARSGSRSTIRPPRMAACASFPGRTTASACGRTASWRPTTPPSTRNCSSQSTTCRRRPIWC